MHRLAEARLKGAHVLDDRLPHDPWNPARPLPLGRRTRVKRKGILGLLRLAFKVMLENAAGWILMGLLAGLAGLGLLIVAFQLLGALGPGAAGARGVLCLSLAPVLAAAYEYAILVAGEKGRVSVWMPFSVLWMGMAFPNAWVASLPGLVGPYAFSAALRFFASGRVGGSSAEETWVVRLILSMIAGSCWLLFLPARFAPLDALVRRCPFWSAIGHCFSLARRGLGLLVAYAGLWILVGIGAGLVAAWKPLPAASTPATNMFLLFSGLVAFGLLAMFCCILDAMVYRELVLREAEAPQAMQGESAHPNA
jgi:hypothetical protein